MATVGAVLTARRELKRHLPIILEKIKALNVSTEGWSRAVHGAGRQEVRGLPGCAAE